MQNTGAESWVTQLRKGLMELCALRLLRHGESYGYEIVQRLRERPALEVSESTVYPVLARLRAEGFVQARDKASASGPPRRYYSLTPRGRARLAELNAYFEALVDDLHQLQSPSQKKESDA